MRPTLARAFGKALMASLFIGERTMIRALAALLLILPLSACLAGAAIGVAGAAIGAAGAVTGAVVGTAVKTTGAVVDAVLPGDDDEEEDEDD